MEPCARLDGSPKRACHNCRRSRRRCDRSIPTCTKCHSTGQACLGYGKLLLWTNSVASRGKMMGKTFAVTAPSEVQSTAPRVSSSSLATRSKEALSHNWERGSTLDPISSWSWQLGDPVFYDLSRSSRFYLSYCEYGLACREPFSGLPIS
jgi:hypothetical protein